MVTRRTATAAINGNMEHPCPTFWSESIKRAFTRSCGRRSVIFTMLKRLPKICFLQAYKKLSTLKDSTFNSQNRADPRSRGWLHAVANRLCIDWMRKQKPATQPLDDASVKIIDNLTYEHYVSEQRESEATECRYETVEKLLAKLPESERTVMMLYYLSEMRAKEIGKSLEVSVNTVRSRLHRARKRLQADHRSS